MYIHKVSIKNFRLLEQVDLVLEKRTTVIVGRNNCGKTSLTELFRRLLSDTSPTFRLEDFSLSAHEPFWKALILKYQGQEENEVRKVLPFIEIKLTVSYDINASNLGPLSDFIIDMNPGSTEAMIVIRYQLKSGEIDAFFADLAYDPNVPEDQQKPAFFRAIKDRFRLFTAIVLAVDPNDPTNQKTLDFSHVQALLQSGFINAQRGLDDITHKDKDVLGKILEALFATALKETADANDREIAQNLEKAVRDVEEGIRDGFNRQLKDFIPAFSLFGYPGLSDPGLLTETTLDAQRLLTNHTKVHYAGVNGIHLPEGYNGLGPRNLIFILFKLLEFFKSFMARPAAPAIHLIFIEEPEVHLHPQMQEVFVSKIGDIAEVFATKFNMGQPWPVQFIITTHSSHLANKAAFESIRYFVAIPDEQAGRMRSAQIKDLRNGLSATPKLDREFLHKYMTLTRCDLLFADKAILIEGTTERLLLPKMIEKVDAEAPKGPQLSSQYVSIVEIESAYAHLFFDLLAFLELPTLIITDLDAVKANNAGKRVACKVSEGTHTSNGCIKNWFKDENISPAVLIKKPDEEKTHTIRRLAYQVPETDDAPCGRSFEAAFILANREFFEIKGETQENREEEAWDKAETVKKKSDFALQHAIDKTEWAVPRYIAEGLRWLSVGVPGPTITASHPVVETPVVVITSSE